jgi:hypothetical protein
MADPDESKNNVSAATSPILVSAESVALKGVEVEHLRGAGRSARVSSEARLIESRIKSLR